MNNGTYGTNYESTGTKTWIPIGDLNNTRAVTVVPTSASPTQLDGTIQPYKLSYVLATPQIVNANDKIEGQLKVNGLTQVNVESGIVRREKAVSQYDTTNKVYRVNTLMFPTTFLKNKPTRFIAIYKNGIKDTKWTSRYPVSLSNGGFDLFVAEIDFDATAIYERNITAEEQR